MFEKSSLWRDSTALVFHVHGETVLDGRAAVLHDHHHLDTDAALHGQGKGQVEEGIEANTLVPANLEGYVFKRFPERAKLSKR